jgi:hypothetical protein
MHNRVSGNRLAVNPWITHERLDDEVMAINLESGAYVALDDTAADCWTLLVAGASVEDMAGALTERYTVDVADARRDVDAFLDDVLRAGLMTPSDDAPPHAPFENPLPPAGERRPYAAPVVQVFDDLEGLLRLDPVHEVDEFGWPVARRD